MRWVTGERYLAGPTTSCCRLSPGAMRCTRQNLRSPAVSISK
jgi:hypothetical protein